MPSSSTDKRPPHPTDPLAPQQPFVARRWLIVGVGITILGGFAAIYFALALLFWQGQWQLIYHPSNTVAQTPQSLQLAFEEVRFDAMSTGQTQLTGWWIPAERDLLHRDAVILYLHEERGSLSDTLPDLLALHALGHDVFAFDPRGFGKSEWAKPSEAHWQEDAEAALDYLVSVRHVPLSQIILVGRGLGGTVGASLTVRHPELHRLVMVDPQPPVLARLETPRWTGVLPVRLLARDQFDPRTALRSPTLHTLFLTMPGRDTPDYVPVAGTVGSTVLGDAKTAPALHRFFEAQP